MNNKTIVILTALFVSAAVLSLLIFNPYTKQIIRNTQKYNYDQKINETSCKRFDIPLSEYVDTYEVKTGDTLLSIAKEQLGSTAKISQIIEMNDYFYPSLSKSSFIEKGWTLQIPNKKYKNSEGKLKAVAGVVYSIKRNRVAIHSADGPIDYLYINEEEASQFSNGICVEAIVDMGINGKQKILNLNVSDPD